MSYKLTLVIIPIVAISVATYFGRTGPRWKGPLIAGVICLVAILTTDYPGLNPSYP